MIVQIGDRVKSIAKTLGIPKGQRSDRQPLLSHGTAAAVLATGANLLRNEALADKAGILGATKILETLGLSSHHDFQKNWDTLKCLAHILGSVPQNASILDAGSGSRGVILQWLYALGYRDLWACDRLAVNLSRFNSMGIRFSCQDLAQTTYEDNQFGAIASVSVIEHGVDLQSFFKEMSRILRPGGRLLISTDYWNDPIDCSGIYPYGVEHGEMKIFTAKEAAAFIETAARFGLQPTSDVDLKTSERAVRWNRVDRDYTFLFIAFEKQAAH